MNREISVSWNQVNSVKDIKVLPEDDKAIACTTNGNFVDVWGFQLKETSKKSMTQREFEVLLENDSRHYQRKQPVKSPVSNLEKKVSDISLAPANQDEEVLEEESPFHTETPKFEPESFPLQHKPGDFNNSAPEFKYIPKVDGSKPVNLDLANFLKQVYSVFLLNDH